MGGAWAEQTMHMRNHKSAYDHGNCRIVQLHCTSMRTKFLCFATACIFTLMLSALVLHLNIPANFIKTPRGTGNGWVAPLKKTVKKERYGTDALHVRRKALFRIDAKRAVELGLDSSLINMSNSPPELISEGILLPNNLNKTPIAKVVQVILAGVVRSKIVSPGDLDGQSYSSEWDVAGLKPAKASVNEYSIDNEPYYDNEDEQSVYTGIEEEEIALSKSTNIDTRGNWQMSQVDRFCSKYKLQYIKNVLPGPKSIARSNLFRHVLYDDNRKLMFCFLPKVGCTNMRRLMFVLSGSIPLKTINWTEVSNAEYLGPGVQQSSLVNPYLSDTQRMERISSYWKFTILRNPLERLVSAFRHRLEAPLDFNGAYNKTFEMIKRSILEDSKPQEFSHWMKSNGSSKLTVDFQTYIRWIVKMPNEKLNEHFIPMIHMSQPCRLRYNFYGNFKQISAEIKLVMQKFDVPSSYFHDKSYYASGHGTATLLQKYYSQLDPKVKLALLKDFSTELDFYYHLFPEDRHTHIDLLGGTK